MLDKTSLCRVWNKKAENEIKGCSFHVVPIAAVLASPGGACVSDPPPAPPHPPPHPGEPRSWQSGTEPGAVTKTSIRYGRGTEVGRAVATGWSKDGVTEEERPRMWLEGKVGVYRGRGGAGGGCSR